MTGSGQTRNPDGSLGGLSDEKKVTLVFAPPLQAQLGDRLSYVPPATNRLQDAAGNPVAAFDVALDIPALRPPALVGASVTSSGKIILEFDEALDQEPLDLSAFTVTGSGQTRNPDGSLGGLSDEKKVTLVFAPPLQAQLGDRLSYVPPATNRLQDAAGNPVVAFDVALDIPALRPPALVGASVTSSGKIILEFDEALDQEPLDLSAFTVTGSGQTRNPDGSLGGLSDEKKVTLVFAPPLQAQHGDRLSYVPPATNRLQDAAGNPVVAFDVALDIPALRPPLHTSAAISTNTVALDFDEALDRGSRPAASAFTVKVKNRTRPVSGVAFPTGDDDTVLVTISGPAVQHGEKVTLSYTPPTTNPLQDAAGNDVVAFTDFKVDNLVPQTPALVGAEVDGAVVTLAFNEDLDQGSPSPPSAFTVKVENQQDRAITRTVFFSASEKKKFSLLIDPGAQYGEVVTVSYNPPPTALALRYETGTAVAAFRDQEVRNLTPRAAVPGVPRSLSAAPGDGQVVLSWTAPSSAGGSAITRYEYRYKAGSGAFGGWTGAGTDLTETVGNLTNGQLHTFEVRAVNTQGAGMAASTTATPAAGAPRITGMSITSTPADGDGVYKTGEPIQVTVEFDQAVTVTGRPFLTMDVGGQDFVTSYGSGSPGSALVFETRRRINDHHSDDDGVNIAAGSVALDYPGEAATIRSAGGVDAVLAHRGIAPDAGHRVNVAAVPGVPRSLSAAPGDGQVVLSWTAPSSAGGSAITRYEYRHKETAAASFPEPETWTGAGTDLTATVGSLTNGQAHTFEVRAVNTQGAGMAASTTATPAAPGVQPPEVSGTAIWSATLTVERRREGGYVYGQVGYDRVKYELGKLDPTDFEHEGRPHRVYRLLLANGGLRLWVTPDFSASGSVTLHAGGRSFALADATVSGGEYVWRRHGLAWRDGDTVAVSLTPAAAAANHAPTGEPAIAGSPQVGQTLTASPGTIADGDGLPDDPDGWSYQWLSREGGVEGGGYAAIPDAAGATYTPVEEDLGRRLKVRASFTDDAGHREAVTSETQTAAVLAAAVEPTAESPAWTATLTVQRRVEEGYVYPQIGYDRVDYELGDIDPAGFDREGTDYAVERLLLTDGKLAFALSPDPGDAAAGLTLHIGAKSFALGAATASDGEYTWSDRKELLWRDGEVVLVSLAPGSAEQEAGSAIAGFTLFDNADGGADVAVLAAGTTPGAGTTLGAQSSERLNIRAETRAGAEIGSVRLELSGAASASRTENHAPYALFGDRGGRALPAGTYTIVATPYPEANLGGTPGTALSVTFTVAAGGRAGTVGRGDEPGASAGVGAVRGDGAVQRAGHGAGDIRTCDRQRPRHGHRRAHRRQRAGHGVLGADRAGHGRRGRGHGAGSGGRGGGCGGQPEHGVGDVPDRDCGGVGPADGLHAVRQRDGERRAVAVRRRGGGGAVLGPAQHPGRNAVRGGGRQRAPGAVGPGGGLAHRERGAVVPVRRPGQPGGARLPGRVVHGDGNALPRGEPRRCAGTGAERLVHGEAARALGGGRARRGGRGPDRRLPGNAGPVEPGGGDGGVRHVGRHGDGGRGLHGKERHADLRAGRDVEDGFGRHSRRQP